ncbi:THAP domain-containing protein [Phthorimaea operculella]|nr:THAP domain-containing protein [Phthorimaea operculella]
MRCCVPNCTNDTKSTPIGQGISFHQFPKEPNLRSSWVEALDMSAWEPKDRSTICSEHFRNEDLCITKSGLRKIRNGALPMAVQTLEDLDAPATTRVCRICLAMDVKMYNLQEYNLDQAFEQVMGSIPSPEDRLPGRICWECAGRLVGCSRFKVKALTSHALMADLLCTRQYITIRDIKSIDRTYNNLKTSLITKCYDVNDYDVLVQDGDVTNYTNDVLVDDQEVVDDGIDGGEITVAPIEVEIKCERQNEESEIFFEEFPDHFESDDDKKLSEFPSLVSC